MLLLQLCAMPHPDQIGARSASRVSGEDAPTWLPAAFAAIGTLVACAAAWLALGTQPTPRANASDEAHAVAPMTSTLPAADAVPVLSRAPGSRSEGNPSGAGSAPSGAVPSPGVPGDAPAIASPQEIRQVAKSSAQPFPKREDCPAIVNVPFKLDSARPITKDVQMDLEELQAFLNGHPQSRLSIEGHADSIGAENYNLLLSYWRAKAVASLLSSAGLPENRMIVRAAGNNANVEGLPRDSGKNRRVALQVIGTENCREAPSARRQ